MLRAIFDAANASFDLYTLNRQGWGLVRDSCQALLDPKGLERYAALFQTHRFDEDLQEEWRTLLPQFVGKDYKDISLSDHEGMMEFYANAEASDEDARSKRIAYHQLQAYSEYLARGENPVEAECYNRFLVSVLLSAFIITSDISRFSFAYRCSTAVRLLLARHQGLL